MSKIASGRRDRKRRRTRGEIHAAALALFAKRGYDAATIGEICAAADVARGTFFLHFPSKAALLHELDRQLAAELRDAIGEPRASAVAEYRTLVTRFGAAWQRRVHGRADLLAALLREVLVPAGPTVPEQEQEQEPAPDLCGLFEDVVRRGQARGELRRGVPPRLAAALFLAGAASLLAESGADAAPEQTRDRLLPALLHGLLDGKPRLKWTPAAAGSAE